MAIEIEVKNLKKKLGPNQALDGVSLSFEPRLMHGVIGPEGAGKTTLLRVLMGLLAPNEGEVIYREDKKPVTFASVRPGMAYMPQQQSLYADLTIEEHLKFFSELYGLTPQSFSEKRERLLSITRLGEFTDRAAGKLSGGMYKKLGLMCALLSSPTVLLLDEPTNGVDPISRREFWELLYQLSDQGILILMTTAYMDEAERCARVHLLENGNVIGSGKPESLLAEARAKNFDEYFLKRTREVEHEHRS